MNPSTNLTWTTVKYSVKRLVGFHHLRYLRIWSPVVRDALFIAYRASIAQFLCNVLCCVLLRSLHVHCRRLDSDLLRYVVLRSSV